MTRPATEAFVARLRAAGEAAYHRHHPFDRRMREGALGPADLRRWVENRYYYQTRLPVKDALIVAKSEDAAFRRAWIRRVHEQDGDEASRGGLELWLDLAEAVGCDREGVRALRAVLPGVRQACDAYVALVRERSLVEAVASSLTELFAPDLMADRIAAWERHYPWVDRAALAYFRGRVVRARHDADEALAFVCAQATTPALQDACVAALEDKCRILWAILDAVDGPTAGDEAAA